jgi:hypothetical protein
VLCRGSGDGDICFALAKHDELGVFLFFLCWLGFLSLTGKEELALSKQTTGPKHTSYFYIVN